MHEKRAEANYVKPIGEWPLSQNLNVGADQNSPFFRETATLICNKDMKSRKSR